MGGFPGVWGKPGGPLGFGRSRGILGAAVWGSLGFAGPRRLLGAVLCVRGSPPRSCVGLGGSSGVAVLWVPSVWGDPGGLHWVPRFGITQEWVGGAPSAALPDGGGFLRLWGDLQGRQCGAGGRQYLLGRSQGSDQGGTGGEAPDFLAQGRGGEGSGAGLTPGWGPLGRGSGGTPTRGRDNPTGSSSGPSGAWGDNLRVGLPDRGVLGVSGGTPPTP